MLHFRKSWLSPLGILAVANLAVAQDPGIEFFEKRIRPILVEHCYECHATDAKKVRGGLLLDSRPAILKGGVSGPALEAGHPEKSLIIKAVHFDTENMKMPPKGKLPAAVIADLEAWIKMGAPDPRDKATQIKPIPPWEEIAKQRKDWWSLQAVRKPTVPLLKDSPGEWDPIDRFIRAKLEEKNLKPAPPAPPHVLIRRLSLTLTGLPPTPTEIAAFEKRLTEKGNEVAVRELTDRLLASSHFGERWARHWMDVIRFSETHGNEWNYEVHHAWRYRDYLIRAFNADVPYDRFILEHIAGDLLEEPRWNRAERFNESLIATAFWRFGEVNHDDCITLPQIGYDLADNQIDTLTKAFQALTVSCARCHDHKFDAVSARDYYAVLGVLRSSRLVSHTLDAPEVNANILERMRAVKQSLRSELADLWLSQIDPKRIEKWLSEKADAKLADDHPLSLVKQITTIQKAEKFTFAGAAKKVADRLAREEAEAKTQEKDYVILADFRNGNWPNWQVGGQGLRGVPTMAGEFVVASEGEKAVGGVLSAGAFTHALSAKLNGTLRSPSLTNELTQRKKYISFRVMGKTSSAVRLVSNNCQLNYSNYRALTFDEWNWLTLKLPEERDALNVYAELMTKFDNPKFPDQLGTLGGDTKNDRIPWEQAAADPRSYFGVALVVLHDSPSPPKADLSASREIFKGAAISSAEDFASRHANRLTGALNAWKKNQANDSDARWIGAFLEGGYLTNKTGQTSRLAELSKQYRELEAKLQMPRIVPGIAESGREFSQAIFTRGDCLKPGKTVARGFVEAVVPKGFAPGGSGRLELARRMATRDNPLTARVMVNRVWHHLFGSGLVRTVDDFGHMGDRPSHPELLDYLADRFIDEGWSIKRLIREIVLTRTFQAVHQPSEAGLEVDPENRLLLHYSARRMEAEAIRDALLCASGRLDRTLYGMSVPAFREKDDDYHRLFRGPLDGNGRRSLYIKTTLMEAPAFLETFNIPGGKVTQGRRDATNVPAQALAMLNDPLVRDQAVVWSKRLVERKNDSVDGRITVMFLTALGREPTTEEKARFTLFAERLAELQRVPKAEILRSQPIWSDIAHTLFNLQEFITIP